MGMRAAQRSIYIAVATLALVVSAVVAVRLALRAVSSGTPAGSDIFADVKREDEPIVRIRLAEDAWRALDERPRRFVEGEIELGGSVQRARIRLKGHRSMRKLADKPAFKLELLGEASEGGVRSLNLNNLIEDPTALREMLGYRFMGELGLPVPRTAYARLELNGEPKGLYLMVEPLDDGFLAHRYDSADGLLYEGEYGCDVSESDVLDLDLDGGDDPNRRKLGQLARAAAGDARQLFDPATSPLDLRAVLAYLSGSAIIGDFDGYRHAHNYYLHQRPSDKKWLLLPWGLDRAFKQRLDLHDSQGILARRCFEDAACRLEYARALQRALATFKALALPDLAQQLATRADQVRGSAPLAHPAGDVAKSRADLLRFLRERPDEVRQQLRCIDADGNELDRDGDGHGCTDCDDGDPAIHPGAVESCDGLDNDCSALVDDSPACECEVTRIRGSRYHLCPLPMPWAEALQFCESKGLTLARVDSRKVSRALYRRARRIDRKRWWIGYSDREREGEFSWSDGERGSFSYWSKNQPNNGTCNEDCVALQPNEKGRWQDTHCGQHWPFICGEAAAAAHAPSTLASPASELARP